MKINRILKGFIPIIFIIAIILMIISFHSFDELYGDAKVINFAGILRAGSQYILNQELDNNHMDSYIGMLNNIIDELKGESGIFRIRTIETPDFQEALLIFEEDWDNLVREIYKYRETGEVGNIIKLSEMNFVLGNKLVLMAQETSESKMERLLSLRYTLMSLSIMVLVIYLYSLYTYLSLNKNNKDLSKIAYIDPLTKLPNRVRCDQVVKEYLKMDNLPNLACVFFDLNNLKETNDTFGHTQGDNLIREFGYILRDVSSKYGFIFRNGGDEFIGIFENVSKESMRKYIDELNEKVDDFNNQYDFLSISFAYGISYSDEDGINSINELMSLADKRMFQNKREFKEKKILNG